MTYEFDAFFSYRRDPRTDHWYDKVKEMIHLWAGHTLGTDPKIFVDRSSLAFGDQAPAAIQQALKRSKCLVCFWTPQYFQSRWCVTEWKTFQHRSEQHGRPLILPVSVHDGKNFPPKAKDTQQGNFNEYFRALPGFWNQASASDFENVLKEFSEKLSAMILDAPTFQEFKIVQSMPEDLQPALPIMRPADD
jgi:hypothetical protein